jgi:hypothetical protein
LLSSELRKKTTRQTNLLLSGSSILLHFLGGGSFGSLSSHMSLLQRDHND